MARKYLVTESEFLSVRVDQSDGHMKFTRDNGEVLDAGKASGDVTPEALAARDAAQTSAMAAAASASQAQQIALGDLVAAQGAVFHVGPTPPASPTQDGFPVLWIDTTEELVPTPVLPPSMDWDDLLSQFTVPSGVVGVDYVWTSGGGGVGATLVPGSTHSTSGVFPRTVTVTPVAKPGYVLASGVGDFVHDFPDPAAVTVLASDTFSGSAATGITGRALDNGAGGTLSPSWSDGAAWNLDGNGRAVASGAVAGIAQFVVSGARNIRVDVDVVTLQESIDLSLRGPDSTGGVSLAYVELYLSASSVGLRVSNGNGGGADGLNDVASGDVLVPGPGNWTLQIVGTTATVIDPQGHVRFWDLSDSSKYDPGSLLTGNRQIWMRRMSAGTTTSINSITVSKVG